MKPVSLLLVASALLLWGCGLYPQEERQLLESRTALARRPPAAAEPLQVRAMSRAQLDEFLARHRGQVVMVDFWATWCPPCVKSIPKLIELQGRYGPKGLLIVGLSLDSSRGEETEAQMLARVQSFCQERGVNYPVFVVSEDVTRDPRWLGFNTIPTAFFLDRSGRVVASIGEPETSKMIDAILAESKDASEEVIGAAFEKALKQKFIDTIEALLGRG